jgi:hypothetical protein
MKRTLSIFLLTIVLLFPNSSGATINWANNATSLIADSGGIGSGATSVTVTTGEGDKFPAVASPHYFMITFVDVSGNREIVKCTARSSGSNTMTIVRGQEGTSPRAFAEGSYVDLRITAGSLDAFSEIVDMYSPYYVCDASAADQADTVNDNSLASLTGDIGTTLNATIILPHSGTGSTTAYNVLQALDLSAYDNITFIFERGAILTYGANAIDMPAPPQAGLYQIFNGTGTFTFPAGAKIYPEWRGAARDGVTDDSAAIQAALDMASSPTLVLNSGVYLFDTRLDIPTNGKMIGAGVNRTILRRKTGASGIAIYSDIDALGIVLEGFTLDCDFAGTNGIDLGNSGSGSWSFRGYMRDIRVIDCAGIAYNLNVDDVYGYNISTDNDVAGSPGTQQVLIAGDIFNCYGMEITGESGTTAGIEFTGNNINIFGMTVSGELHLTKHIRFNGGDNNAITGLNIVTEDNTKTYTQLIYFESGSQENLVRDIEIEKGATDTITNSVQDDENSRTVTFATDFQRYDQTGHDHSDYANGGIFSSTTYMGVFTRDTTLASGQQNISGVGFLPKVILFFVAEPNTPETSWGFSMGSGGNENFAVYNNHNISAESFQTSATECIYDVHSAGNVYVGSIFSLSADGFAMDWTKVGTPSGTITIFYLAIR